MQHAVLKGEKRTQQKKNVYTKTTSDAARSESACSTSVDQTLYRCIMSLMGTRHRAVSFYQ